MMLRRAFADVFRTCLWRKLAPDATPKIVIAIALIGPDDADDWETIEANLERTLSSLKAQTYTNFDIVLSCQRRPKVFEIRDGWHFVLAPPKPAGVVSDQKTKLRLISAFVSKTFPSFVYFVPLDADDVLHPELFRYAADGKHGNGYLIESGYSADLSSDAFAPLSAEAEKRLQPFYKHCGSCALLGVDFSRGWLARAYMSALMAGHQHYAPLAARFGYPLAPVPFPAALYVINHGENMRKKRGKASSKDNYLRHFRIEDPEEIARIKLEFGL